MCCVLCLGFDKSYEGFQYDCDVSTISKQQFQYEHALHGYLQCVSIIYFIKNI